MAKINLNNYPKRSEQKGESFEEKMIRLCDESIARCKRMKDLEFFKDDPFWDEQIKEEEKLKQKVLEHVTQNTEE